jgi:GrpB-like predicted nucleotidyltransferase (UPF0157 family)
VGSATSRCEIDHIGSTSVPGLAAKPIIDIQISVAAFKPLAAFSGPRIVDSAELLAACLYPEWFTGHLDRYLQAVRRVDAKLQVHAWDG